MWSLLPSSQTPALSPILSEMNTDYTAPTFHEDKVLYCPPIYDHMSLQRNSQTPKPRGIFPNTFFYSEKLLRSRRTTPCRFFAIAYSLCSWKHAPCMEAVPRIDDPRTRHVVVTGDVRVRRQNVHCWWSDELVKLPNVWRLIVYLRIWENLLLFSCHIYETE
jgi:hypothetical protein